MKADYFIYVGNAYPHKNLSRLIQAIILLNKNRKVIIELKIVSSRNVFTQKLQSEIDGLNAGNFVTLLNEVADKELTDLYKNSLGFIFPSLSEGFGLPGIEAMRTGTLVLASDIPVFREIYQDSAIYFDPLDVNSIEKVMEKTLKMDGESREQKIIKARDFVKRYSWVKMAKETLVLYESCNSIRSGK